MNNKFHCLLSLLITLAIVLLLCACESSSIPDTQNNGFDLNSDLVTPDDPFGNSENEAEFIPDYLPGEENAIGNIWTNRTLCRQGDYIYHYNCREKCLQKWKADEEFDNAETICYIDSDMFYSLGSDDSDFAPENHLEVVGNYMYLCIQTGEVVGGLNLRSIVRIKTDGSEQTTLVSDCNDCQFRIVDNTLFYLSASIEQHDLNTADYYIIVKAIDLTDELNLEPYILAITNVTDISTSESWGNVLKFFVAPLEEKYVLGYGVVDENRYIHYIRHDATKDGPIFTKSDFRYSSDGPGVFYPNFNGQVLTPFVGETTQGWFAASSIGIKAYDIDSWPDRAENGTEIFPPQFYCSFKCVADEMLFLSIAKESKDTGIYIYSFATGENKKINNDEADQIEYVGDGKIYYYVKKISPDTGNVFCCCNLDGSNWKELDCY